MRALNLFARRTTLERLEDRTLLAGDLLITTEVPGQLNYNLMQFTQQGSLVSSQKIPQSPTATEYQDARGLTVDPSGNVHIADGFSAGFLDSYSPGHQPAWTYQTTPNWLVGSNASYGEAAAYKNYVFASAQAANGANYGVLRFNTAGGSPTLFAAGTSSYQVTLGLDGNLYELVGIGLEPYPNPTIDVYNPDTLALVRSFQLSTSPFSDIRSIAVDGSGNIFAADWGGTVTEYNPAGAALKSQGGYTENLINVAIDSDGQIAVGGRNGGVYLTNESLSSLQSFQTNQWDAFVTFDHYIGTAPQTVAPTVTVADAGGVYTGSAYPVSAASVVGQSGAVLASLGAPSLSYSYYQGTLTAAQIATATPLAGAPINAGNYTVVAHFTSNIGPYTNADSAPALFSITPAPVTLTIANDSQTYGTPANLAKDLGATVSTGINNETLDIAYASTGDTATASVGSYALTGSLSNGSGLVSNYNVTLNNGTLTVNPDTFTYTIGNDSQIAGLPANLAVDLPGTVAGVNGESLNITYASTGDTATATPGKYSITGTLSSGTGLLSNYSVTLNPGTLTVAAYGPNVVVNTLLDAAAANASLNPFDTNGSLEISLRSALAYLDANGGGSVTFAASLFSSGPATIALSLGDLPVTQAITIAGPGAGQLTINAGGNSRIFYVYNSATTQVMNVSISGMTLTGGNGTGSRTVDNGRGGALFSAENLALSHVVITNSSANTGGGLDNARLLTSTGNVFSGNHATGVAGDGGGILNTGIMSSTGDTISANTAAGIGSNGQGGGIWNGSDLVLANDIISGNTAGGSGGGIANLEQLTSSGDTISGNTGVFQGGGIYNDRTLSSTLDTISGNTTNPNINGGSFGGGIYDDGSASLNTSQDTISGNQAVGKSQSGLGGPARGGGVYIAGQAIYISSGDTISGNLAQGGAALAPAGGSAGSAWGGGVEVSSQAVVSLTNDTISGNSAIGGIATSTTGGMVTPGSGGGGGIDNTFGSLALTADTIAGNSVVGGTGTSTNGIRASSPGIGGGIYNGGGTINLIDAVVIGNSAVTTAANVYGSLSAASRANVVDTPVAQVLATGPAGNPLLANNGGPTETIALVPRTTNPAVGTAVALATLESGLNATDASDTITVDSTTFLAVGDALKIGSEIVTIQQFGTTANTLVVLRGQGGTTEASHSASDAILLANDQRGLPRHAAADLGAFEAQVVTPTVTVADSGGVYMGSAYSVTAASVVGRGGAVVVSLGDPSLSYSYYQGTLTAAQIATATPLAAAPTNAGNYTVVAHFTSNLAGYTNADSSPTPFSITPAPLTYTIGNDSQTYGSPANLVNDLAATISTGVNNETFDIAYASTGDTANANVSSYAIAGTLSNGSGSLSNYSVTLNNGTLTVNPYTFSYTIGNDSQIYGSPASLAKDLGTTIAGVNNETLDISYASTGDAANANVGSFAITGSLSNGSGLVSNYNVTLNNGTLTVKPYTFTYTIGNDSQTYGSPANLAKDLGTTITGVNNETLGISYASTGDAANANVGGYAITGSLSNGSGLVSNYSVTLSNGTLTVNPYTFTYTIGNDSQTYGSPANLVKDLGTTITGVNGETLEISYASTGDAANANVGSYTITGSLSNGSGLLSNYSVTLNNGTLTINPYAFTYTIGNDSQTYGSPANLASDLATTITGVNNETLDIGYASTGDTANANVGSYTITGTLSAGSGSLSNYSVTLNNGTLTVNPYAFTYSIGNDSQTYGSPANLAKDLGATISTGINNQTLDISYASTGDKANASVGSYAITGTLSAGSGLLSNYSVTLKNGTLSVNPYAFTFTIGNDSQSYGSPANLAKDLGTTITGVNNETLDISYASTGDAANANVGSYVITGSLSNGSGILSNYKVTLNNGTLAVSPYAFTYTIGNDFQAEGIPANLAADLPGSIPGVNGQSLNIAYASAGDNAAALPGQYPITGTLSNGAGQVSNYSVTLNPGALTVAGPGAAVFGSALYLVGGNTSDKVTITPVGTSNTGSTGINVNASLDGININNRVYSQSFQTIYVAGFGGNDHIQFDQNLTISAVVVEGNGDDQVQLGNGNNTVTVGSGSDKIQVGNGNNVILGGSGNDTLAAGNGDNLIVGGLGRDDLSAGNGNNILVDGSVSQSADQLWSVLNEWIAGDISDVRADLAAHVTYNTTNSNTLHAGSGRDWFWETYAKDHVNIKSGDLLN